MANIVHINGTGGLSVVYLQFNTNLTYLLGQFRCGRFVASKSRRRNTFAGLEEGWLLISELLPRKRVV